MDTNDKIKIGLAIGVSLLILYIVYKILGKVGLVKSAEKEQREEYVNDLRSSKLFDPSYHLTKAFKPLGSTVANIYIKDLKGATGLFNDKEELIYSTFAKLNNKVNISELANAFQQTYKKDLRSYLIKNLNEKEMEKLYTIIKKLPEF